MSDRRRGAPEAGDPRRSSVWEGTGEDLRLTPLGDAVSSLLRARGLTGAGRLAEVSEAWVRAVGEDVAAQVAPVALRHGELVCEVSDPAWATQVRLLSGRLLQRLEEELGHPVADRCSVRVRRRSEG